MIWPFCVLALATLLELVLWFKPLAAVHKALAGVAACATGIATACLFFPGLTITALIITLLSFYRLINLARIMKQRMQADYLRRAAARTSIWLMGLQAAALAASWAADASTAAALTLIYGLAAGQLAVIAMLLASTLRNLRTTRPPRLVRHYTDKELPSLTVAIPARNETSDLQACLDSLTASSYPKLEIIVLDDCSQNKRTPEIIREYAQRGVRFLAGTAPPTSWTAKNFAYSRLAKAASGELLLFCGVDTRFEPHSLTNLVRALLQKNKTMISVMPRNVQRNSHNPLSAVVQANRYSWELSLPRRLVNRPPVLSTCWLIRKQALTAAGGFEAVRRFIVPEAYFAKRTASQDDGYSFMRAGKTVDISTRKSLEEQVATSVRVRYPQLHRRPEMVAVLSIAQYTVLVWPAAMLVVALLTSMWTLAILASASWLTAGVMYTAVMSTAYHKLRVSGVLLLPLAAFYDIGLLNYSMWQYEFREVIWKDRNICLPAMHAIPRLPSLPPTH